MNELPPIRRKTAKDFPRELLELYDFYAHGRITKREFMDRAAKFAVGGVTATMLLRELSQFSAARDAFLRALDLRRQIGDLPGTAAVLDHLGAVAADLGELDQAVDYLEAAIAQADDLEVLPVPQHPGQRRGQPAVDALHRGQPLILRGPEADGRRHDGQADGG